MVSVGWARLDSTMSGCDPSGSACAAKTRQRRPPVSGAPAPFRTAERLSVAWADSLAGVWPDSLAGVWATAGAIRPESATKTARIRQVGLNPPRIAEKIGAA